MGELWEILRVLAWSFLESRAMDKELNPVWGQAAMECLHVLEAREWAGKWDPKLKVRLRREKNPIFCYHPNLFHLTGEIPHDRGIHI